MGTKRPWLSPGTDSCGLSIQAKWRVVCQRDEKVAKCRSWTVCCVWSFPPGQGVAPPGLCCLTVTCDLQQCQHWPLQGPPCQLSFIFLSPVSAWWRHSVTDPSIPAPAVLGSPWIQERHELVWFLRLCSSVTSWHSAAASRLMKAAPFCVTAAVPAGSEFGAERY